MVCEWAWWTRGVGSARQGAVAVNADLEVKLVNYAAAGTRWIAVILIS